MRRLSSIILSLVLSVSLLAQKSPHGDSFRTNCDDCHKTDGWKVDLKTISFDHNGTKFPLVGQHQSVNCKECHTSLEFAKAQTECNACHTDIHEQTVGNECARCHTPNSWMVTNVSRLHQQSRFPLIGPHTTVECRACHKNLIPSTPSAATASHLRFDPLGIECYDCHKVNYLATTRPNHRASNYSTNCTDCHNMNSFAWEGAGINHNFFPLTGGHQINDCKTCHKTAVFSGLSKECVTCHQPDYNSAANPNHKALNFSTNCSDCHSLTPGWKPAEYREHDAGSFPIYSGKHKGEWNSCADCHTNPGNYSQYSCTNCHEHSNKSDVDNEHEGVNGYAYNSIACYGCHPTGSGGGSFDHAANGFPLTNGHASVDCAKCHTNGFVGTSNACASCHTNNYNQTMNPNHIAASISKDCATCHTTNPDWKPATYPTHSNLQGVHIPIANDCATCHKGNYTNLPKTCFDCHAANYTQSTNPSHSAAQFPTTCEVCHSQTAWVPSTFNHATVYPLIGAHATIAKNCIQCHSKGYPNTPNTCAGCHQINYNQTTNPNHITAKFPTTCLDCHSQTAWSPSTFNHNTVYPLIGAHATVASNCVLCHANGYANTPTTCVGCHQTNFNQTTDPNHITSKFPTTCETCHSQSAWIPATFNHNTVYPLTGAHATVATNCELCHANGYTNTPSTCVGCHQANYNQSVNPSHTKVGISTDCATCHTTNPGWEPATFPTHNNYYVLAGAHVSKACADCHKGNYITTPNTCAGCHTNDYNQTTNPNHTTSQFPKTCETCHTSSAWVPSTFNHTSVYPLIGAHKTVACTLCHTSGYVNTPNTCAGCHTNDYNQTTNPNHVTSQFPKTCETCHTPSAWTPSSFNHTSVYPLIGAHKTVACTLCHASGYVNTPNTCAGCHTTNYNQTTNPNHASAQFPKTCADCHTQTAWTPANWNHDSQYFPIYSGKHQGEWSTCADCHKTATNYALFTCIDCHEHNQTDMNSQHNGVSNYTWTSTACYSCHPQGRN